MITNSELTIYHKTFNTETRLENWIRFNYSKAWVHETQDSNINMGYENANIIKVRLPYSENNLDIKNFKRGDIVVPEKLNFDIETQQDLIGHNFYNIRNITNNTTGLSPHIHLMGE